MGVTGLWRLVEPAGRPVPLETLENKVLAVDISIWLHQMVKGYRDGQGAAVANSHLIGLFQRLCKLLHYRIKPVFVFDGRFPVLKLETITERKNKKSQMHSNVEQIRQQLKAILLKQTAVKTVLSATAPIDKKSPTKRSPIKPSNSCYDEELFKLPPMAIEDNEIDSTDESDSDDETSTKHQIDLHSIDVKSEYFKNLTPREKHDLLTELKETRKQNSWGRLHELPVQSDDFSDYQMNRLLKRRQVQVSLEEAEKEIGGHFLSINELEVLLNEEGISTKIEQLPTRRIASDDSTRFILIKDVRKAIEKATKKDPVTKNDTADKSNMLPSTSQSDILQIKNKLGGEFDEDLKAAIQLSLDSPNEVKNKSDCVDLTQFGGDFVYDTDSDWSVKDESEDETNDLRSTELSLAKAYMLENSGLSEYEIMRIINTQRAQKNKIKKVKRVFRPEDAPQADIIKPVTQNGVILAIDKLSQPLDEIEQVPSDVTKNEEKDFESISKSVVEMNSVNVPKIENVVLSSEDDDANDKILKSEKSCDISEVSCSDSDDSFEDVPEPSLTDVIRDQPLLQLVVKPNTILEDDIFADIFQVTNQPKLLEQLKDITNEKSNHISQVNLVTSKIAIPALDVNKEENKPQLLLKIDHLTPPIISKKINFLHKDESTTVVEIDNTPLTPPKPIIDNINALNESPQKGMPLNKIRHLISQEEEPKISEVAESKKSKKAVPIASQRISAKELSVLADDLEVQKDQLEKEHDKLDRMGRNISEEMTKDTQNLLEIFGIPFIVAPEEAEAQCAFLETINLTDGTITDDSDIWLFGGKTVYKNFFNQQKYVQQFLSENIQQCFKLRREHLIQLALLVGSDYTAGINGVGPVTALEILAAFPSNKTELVPPYVNLLAGLKNFRSWYRSSRTMGNSNLRNKLKNISLSEEFPSFRVVEAYLSPEVEKSNEKFSWGKPDLTAIREFTREKFGWTQTKTDEVIIPVLKRLDDKVSQQSIRSFFRTKVKVADASDNMSKRVKNAIERMGGHVTADITSEEGPSASKKPKIVNERKRKAKPIKVVQPKDLPTTSDVIQEIVQLPQASNVKDDKQTVQKKGGKKFSYPERHTEQFPQREKDKNKIFQNKIKAIELFRTSKGGPGFVNKRKKGVIKLKEDAELSENSD